MPIPPDDTLPVDNAVSGTSASASKSITTTEEVLEKFKELNTEAGLEEADGEEGEDEDHIDGEYSAGQGETMTNGVEGEGGKRKKKKKKGKASKAVAKLK